LTRKAKAKYESSDIKVLDEISHIQLNPGMYIGSTEHPGHLIEEGLDNALDECMAGYANIIGINIDTKKKEYSIMDNGRGLPFEDNIPEIVSSKLFSGAKFQDSKTVYEISSGLHGCGLVAVNALSSEYEIEVYRDGKRALYKWKNAKLVKKSIINFNGEIPFSTKIKFKPSIKIFESVIPDIDRIRKRLSTACSGISGDKVFAMSVDGKREIFKLTLEDHFKQQCLSKADKTIGTFMIESSNEPESFNVMMTYSLTGTIAPKVVSSINLLPVDGGGTHVNGFYDVLREFFQTKAKKDYNFQLQDALCGLRCYLMLNLKTPHFAGQTKDKLTNRKTDLEIFLKQLRSNLETHFNKNKDQLVILLEHFEHYRKKLDSNKVKGGAANGKRASTKFTKLRDCSSKAGELFIVEGDSAGGGFVSCRNPRIHAVLPLRGKIPSAANAKDILKNKEIAELIGSLGTGVGPNFDLSKLKYDKVICATDADSDGHHIFCLLTLVLAMLVPDIIKNGHYYLAETPLYAINDKRTFKPIWTEKQLEAAKKTGKHITRYKGLGELNPDQLKVVTLDEKTRRLIPIEYTSDIDQMIKLFSSADEKRKLLER